MKLLKISWNAEALRVHFTGAKRLSLTPEKQPRTIIPPKLYTLHHVTLLYVSLHAAYYYVICIIIK